MGLALRHPVALCWFSKLFRGNKTIAPFPRHQATGRTARARRLDTAKPRSRPSTRLVGKFGWRQWPPVIALRTRRTPDQTKAITTGIISPTIRSGSTFMPKPFIPFAA